MKKIALTGKYGQGKSAIVDDEDYQKVIRWKWFYHKYDETHGYVAHTKWSKENKKYLTIKIHRFILNPPANMVIDHINGDTLDNRKSNLRVCTNTENGRNAKIAINNKSGYKGVSWFAEHGRWRADIRVDGN